MKGNNFEPLIVAERIENGSIEAREHTLRFATIHGSQAIVTCCWKNEVDIVLSVKNTCRFN